MMVDLNNRDYVVNIVPSFKKISKDSWLVITGESVTSTNSVGEEIMRDIVFSGSGKAEEVIEKILFKYSVGIDEARNSVNDCFFYLVKSGAITYLSGEFEDYEFSYDNLHDFARCLDSPLHIAWHLTSRCNLDCGFCYSRNRGNDQNIQKNQLLLDKLLESNVLSIRFGGGESFLYKGFFDIARRASQSGIDVKVTTHGGVFNREIARKVGEAGFSSIGISLDGASSIIHDQVRGAGAFNRAVKTAKEIRGLGIPLEIVTVITKKNMGELIRISDLAEELGAYRVQFKDLKLSGGVSDQGMEFGLSFDEKKIVWDKLFSENFCRNGIVLDIGVNTEPLQNSLYGDGSIKSCSCGNFSACLRENGDITPCSYSNNALGNLLSNSLQTIWKREKPLESYCKLVRSKISHNKADQRG